MYRDNETGAIALTHSDVRLARPGASLPAVLTDADIESAGFSAVQAAPQPSFDPISQKCDESIQNVNGAWTQVWAVTDLPADQTATNLLAAKGVKRAQINQWRLEANTSTFTHQGKTFAVDALSRSDIDGVTSYVTLVGALPPGWPGGWKAVDNTYLPITTIDDWKAFIASMVAAGNANFAKAQALKAQLESAATSAQIDAIQW